MSELNEDYLKEYCFAFSTMKQLERWFPKTDRDLLHDNSYYISLYSVPREFYIRATNQCIFIKEKSTLVKKIDIKEYYTKLIKKVKKVKIEDIEPKIYSSISNYEEKTGIDIDLSAKQNKEKKLVNMSKEELILLIKTKKKFIKRK